MNKQLFFDFFNKVNLKGINSKIEVYSKNDVTNVRCIDNDKILITDISCKSLLKDDEHFAVGNLDQFIKFFQLISSDIIDYELIKNQDQINYRLTLKDKNININYMLSFPSVIPKPPEKFKKDPEWHFSIDLSDKESGMIINSLDISKSILIKFIHDNKKIWCNIGNLQDKETVITIEFEKYQQLKDTTISEITFNGDIFKSILGLNRSGKLEIAFDGIYRYTSNENDIEAIYYQKSLIIKN